VGCDEGRGVGGRVGEGEGACEGLELGLAVGGCVGSLVGSGVGRLFSAQGKKKVKKKSFRFNDEYTKKLKT